MCTTEMGREQDYALWPVPFLMRMLRVLPMAPVVYSIQGTPMLHIMSGMRQTLYIDWQTLYIDSLLLFIVSDQSFMQPSGELSQGSCIVLQTLLTVTGLCSQDTVAALKVAHAMRKQGRLPSTLSLWAVSNPLRDPPDSLLRKVLRTAPPCSTKNSPHLHTFGATSPIMAVQMHSQLKGVSAPAEGN